MGKDRVVDFLVGVAPFSELTRADVSALAGDFRERDFPAGADIGRFSPPGQHGLYVIQTGAVELVDMHGQALEQRGNGDLFGHRIALEGGVDDYMVRTCENSKILQLPSARLSQLRERHPALDHFLSASPGERMRAASSSQRGSLAELNLRRPVTIDSGSSIRDCAELMAKHQVSCLPIVDNNKLVGIVTDRDLRSRVLARGLDSARSVSEIMTREPLSAQVHSRIDDATVTMMRLGIHHLPIMDEDGQLAGVVSAGDLARVDAPHPLRLVRDIQRAEGVNDVASLALQGPGLLARMAGQGSEVTEVGRIASMITDACTRRLLALAEVELGPAPMAWTWLAFGSQARMEQGLVSDQDNGLLLAEEPDSDQADYFLKLATFVCDGLDACGYVYCAGDVMAMKKWRMSLGAWSRTFDRWMREPEPQSVMNCSIFFDLRGVAGDLALAGQLQHRVLEQARDSRIFLRFLATESIGHTPPLGLFRQFLKERNEAEGQGINLKKRGVIPIVDLARVRALESALTAVHTEERIEQAAAEGHMNEHDADDLIHALRFIGNIRLKHQVRLYERGEKPNHLVDPDELSGLHRRYLRSAFGIVRQAQKALAQRYQV